MSFIKVAMGEAPTPGMAPEARYPLRIVNVKEGRTNADDRDKLAVIIEIEGGDWEPVFETFVLPNENDWSEDDGKLAKLFIGKLKSMMYLFGVSWQDDGIDADSLLGAIAESAMLTTQTGDDGVERNKIMYPRPPQGV